MHPVVLRQFHDAPVIDYQPLLRILGAQQRHLAEMVTLSLAAPTSSGGSA